MKGLNFKIIVDFIAETLALTTLFIDNIVSAFNNSKHVSSIQSYYLYVSNFHMRFLVKAYIDFVH